MGRMTMRRFPAALAASLAVCLVPVPAAAQRPEATVPDPGKDKDYDWRKVGAGEGLQPEDVKRLEERKLLVPNCEIK